MQTKAADSWNGRPTAATHSRPPPAHFKGRVAVLLHYATLAPVSHERRHHACLASHYSYLEFVTTVSKPRRSKKRTGAGRSQQKTGRSKTENWTGSNSIIDISCHSISRYCRVFYSNTRQRQSRDTDGGCASIY